MLSRAHGRNQIEKVTLEKCSASGFVEPCCLPINLNIVCCLLSVVCDSNGIKFSAGAVVEAKSVVILGRSEEV